MREDDAVIDCFANDVNYTIARQLLKLRINTMPRAISILGFVDDDNAGIGFLCGDVKYDTIMI